MPDVLFVSKPVEPPWHDGSKNLVRDVATSLERWRATVLTSPEAPPLERIRALPVYRSSGRFSPSLVANARVLAALARARGFDAWHFVFAPNAASSTAARAAMLAGRLRGVRRVVQTIASRPRRFEGVRALLFGHVVVALSEWTRARLLASGVDGKKLVVIPPCSRPARVPSADERARVRAELDLGSGPIVLYPGDLEVSSGAATMMRAAPSILGRIPEARIVFACRKKTARAEDAEARLRQEARALRVDAQTRFVGELADLAPLLHEASVVALPADDLYGKVDVPLVVVEALAAGIPLLLARGGPLETVETARFVDPGDADSVAIHCAELAQRATARSEVAEAGRALYARVFEPRIVAQAYEALYDGG